MSIRDRIRRYLGTRQILNHLADLEERMANAVDQLNELKTAFSDFADDVNAKLEQLNTAQGDFTPEAQAVFDELKQAVADADAKVGDADGSDTPAEPGDGDVPAEDGTGR